jgi:CRP-like cAMP-binding protein
MPVDIDSPEGHLIRKMVPFSTMPNAVFKVICDKVVVENARSGAFLFKRGDTDSNLIYLLKGEVSLEVDKLKMEIIKAGTESARFALAHQLPRKVNAVAKGAIRYVRLNSIYIRNPNQTQSKKANAIISENMLPEEPLSIGPAIKEGSKENSHTWITTLLMIPILRALPPTSLHKISSELEEVVYQKDEMVIRQGDAGDYYYIIKNGECLISHRNSLSEKEVKVAKLRAWDTFGEFALIANEPRGETVTALTELSLLRLNKEKFVTLIKEPSLKLVDYVGMEKLLAEGGILLDIRPPDEFEGFHLEKAINAPLFTLRTYLKSLNKEQPIVVVSDDDKMSESGAFLLLTYNFNANILSGGIKKVPVEGIVKAQQTIEKNSTHEDVIFDRGKSIKSVIEPPSTTALAAENEQLRKKLREFKSRIEKSEHEKRDLLEKYQLLLKQSERLKAALESLKK